jgi:hypothetical protein
MHGAPRYLCLSLTATIKINCEIDFSRMRGLHGRADVKRLWASDLADLPASRAGEGSIEARARLAHGLQRLNRQRCPRAAFRAVDDGVHNPSIARGTNLLSE